MPSINQCIEATARIQTKDPKAAVMWWGSPGQGKTDATVDVHKRQGLPMDRYMSINLTNHEVWDFIGCPEIVDSDIGRTTSFAPTDIFARFRKGTGAGTINLEELPQSTHHHQTWAAGFIEDRKTTLFELDPEVRIICTGNRAEDRAGSKPLLAHLNDRLWHMDMETSLDDWCGWAMNNDVDPLMIAFLRLRPDLLNAFDPNNRSNPTQRSWTKLSKQVPNDLPTDLYMICAEGKVGEGAAAEWVAARDMMHKMPSIDSIRLHPDRAEVPTEPAVRFAVATALSMTTEPEAFARDMQYVSRMPKEFQMVYVTDALRLHPDLHQTKDFINWAVANKDIFMGGN